MPTITGVVNTLNEEKYLEECLKSLAGWVDELIVVDMHSDDRTREIAARYTQHIYLHDRMGFVEPARNFAIQQATSDWVIILDADERVPMQLAQNLRHTIATKSDIAAIAYYSINNFFGKWIYHSGFFQSPQIRVFRRGAATYSGAIHQQPTIDGKVHYLELRPENAIIHFAHPEMYRFVEKMNRYTSVYAEANFAKGKPIPVYKLLLAPVRAFLHRYIRCRGYKDGLHGLLISLLMATYVFLERAKLWELWYKHTHDDAIELEYAASLVPRP